MCLRSSSKIFGIVLTSFILVSQPYAQEMESKSTPATESSKRNPIKNSYFTPYVGGSTLTGNLGVEFQQGNIGYDIGILKSGIAIDTILCGGIRKYFQPHQHSWVVGFGGGIALKTPGPNEDLCGPWSGEIPDDWVCNTGSVIDKYLGILVGYRWIWWDQLCMNIGAGPNYIIWKKIKEGSKAKYLPMLEFSFGYSF